MPEELPWLAGQYRIDSTVTAIEEALGRKAASLGYANLSNAERIVLAVEALEREVNNGRYGQFFENAVAYMSTIVEADALDACDREYYASGEDIAARLFAFIQSNPDDIIL